MQPDYRSISSDKTRSGTEKRLNIGLVGNMVFVFTDSLGA